MLNLRESYLGEIALGIRRLELGEVDLTSRVLVESYLGESVDEVGEHVEWHLRGFPEFCLAAEEGGEI